MKLGQNKFDALNADESVKGQWQTSEFEWLNVGDVHSCSTCDMNHDTGKMMYGAIINVKVESKPPSGSYTIFYLKVT